MFKYCLIITLCSAFCFSYQAVPDDNSDVLQFFKNLTDAFNNRDLESVVSSWEDNGEIITLAGGILKGHQNIRQEYARAFAGAFKDAKYQYYVQFVRLKDNSATVDGIWKTKNGPVNYPSCGLFLQNLVRKNGFWKTELAYFSVPKTGHTSEVGRTLSWTKICSE